MTYYDAEAIAEATGKSKRQAQRDIMGLPDGQGLFVLRPTRGGHKQRLVTESGFFLLKNMPKAEESH